MSPSDYSPPLNDDQRVRILWDKFERWAQSQRKLLERRRADIIYKQNAKRKKSSSRGQNHAAEDDDDEITKQQLEGAGEDHINMLLNVWHDWMESQQLGPDAWGTRTIEEAERIARLFQTEDAIDRLPPPLQHLYTQPQSAPVYKPVPPMTSAGRRLNFSSSTSSSKFVDPSSLSTDDDEADDGEESFQLATDEYDNEFWMPSKACGLRSKSFAHSSQNASPDHLSSSGSSAFEVLQPPSLSSSLLETHIEPPKRPPDIDQKGKARARGPTYVGPHLLRPEESSDEDDFAMLRMQTRINKIWEFHLAAARADVELVIAVQNELLSKDSSWDEIDYERRIFEHEKRMEKLRDEKEEERQELVVAERKRRQEGFHQRPALREHADARTKSDWESLFQNKVHKVHFDAEKRSFSLGDETQTRGTMRFESHMNAPAPAPSDYFGAVHTRKQSQSNVPSSSSGWKTKTSSATASSQAGSSTSSGSRSWIDRSLEDNDGPLDFDGTPAQNFNPLPPMPAGWGEKSWGEKPSANALLKKVLSDPPSRKYSLSSVVEPNSNVELNVDTKSQRGFGSSKRLEGRQPFDFDTTVESPTTSAVNASARGLAGMTSTRHVRQSRHAHLQTDDEMSSTPRPRIAPAFGAASWKMNGQDTVSRQAKLPARDSHVEDEGWANVHSLAGNAMEAMMKEEDSQWGHKQTMREGWGRSIQSNGNVSATSVTKQSPTGPEVSLWQQQQQKARSRGQPSTLVNVPKAEDVQEDFWAAARAKINAETTQPIVEHHSIVTEETPWQRMQRLKAEKPLPSTAGSSMNPFDQPPARKGLHSSKPSWSKVSNLEDSVTDMFPPSVPAQFPNKYWTPNGTGSTSHNWSNGEQSTAKHSMTMPGGYMSDTQRQYDNFGPANVSSYNARMRSSYTKHASVEEEPDEDGPGGRDAQIGALPYDSRFILDVAVPKPIHPPEAYSEVIDYGEDPDEENEWDHSLSSPVQTPSTAPTSPPSDLTEEWMNAVTENLKSGKLEDTDLKFESFGTDLSNKTKPVSASSGPPTKQSVWGAQKSDTVKVQSAPQSAPTSSTSPPKAVPTSDTSTSSKAAVPTPAKTTAATEKPEPVIKTGNQNQKGKKGKGKGKK
ncbi:hypothetical protein C0992_002515 [Termitomyces sp. T32_za158]|nr:hypothetical protein C0992_002515 [Termitomyces sp. T32_za158]